jgi:hypothetical protein
MRVNSRDVSIFKIIKIFKFINFEKSRLIY